MNPSRRKSSSSPDYARSRNDDDKSRDGRSPTRQRENSPNRNPQNRPRANSGPGNDISPLFTIASFNLMGLRDSPKKLHEEMVKSGRLGKREARRAHRLFSSGLPLKMLEEQYEKKIAWSASTLKSVDAQVWGFQELW
mmetsp:Transcript_13212/g.17126  ORF Transcript_13212/g.17126 Transcript_13212/m.17126 type:complete len:138 (-) Transcript_13212:11-424(-)